MESQLDRTIKEIAKKLRRIRELKGLTREDFCEPLGENSEYWGQIERGEQPISLVKLLHVCAVYNIPIEEVVHLEYATTNNDILLQKIAELLTQCNNKQLEIVQKFIEEIVLAL